jgi:hypothetical protein
MAVMAPFRRVPRGAGSIGVALTLVDLWSRLTPSQRRLLLAATRKHGPRVVRTVATRVTRKR